MKVVTIGGNGYLGKKIIESLELSNHVFNIEHGSNSRDEIKKILDRESVIDWVLNFSGAYGQDIFLYKDCLESQLNIPLIILDEAAKHGVKNYLTIGTALPDRFNMYAFSKSIFAEFGKYYCDKMVNEEFCFINVDLQMFYGSDEPQNRFITGCIRRLMNNEKLELTVGTQKRDIIHIDDVKDAILCIMQNSKPGYSSIPIGTGEGIPLREIIEYVKKIIKSNSNLDFGAVPMRKNEPDCIADIAYMETIGFHCKHSWRDGIKKVVEEFINDN